MLDAQRPFVRKLIRMISGAHHLRPVRPGEGQRAVCGVEVPTEREEQAEEQRHAFPRKSGPVSPLLFVDPHRDLEEHLVVQTLYRVKLLPDVDLDQVHRPNLSGRDRLYVSSNYHIQEFVAARR
jgi:hypothetical protein